MTIDEALTSFTEFVGGIAPRLLVTIFAAIRTNAEDGAILDLV